METTEAIVECLRRKGCAMTVARLTDELTKPPQVIEANLGVLRRAGLVQILRPGEWELAPEKRSDEPPIPPPTAPAPSRDTQPVLTTAAAARVVTEERARGEPGPRPYSPYARLTPPPGPPPAATTEGQENIMPKATKTCVKCKQEKGITAFHVDDNTCRACHGGKAAKPAKVAKPQGGVRKKAAAGANGAVRSLREVHTRHVRKNGDGRFAHVIAGLRADRDAIDKAIAQLEALG